MERRKLLSEDEVLKLDWVQQLIKEYPEEERLIVECARGYPNEVAARYALWLSAPASEQNNNQRVELLERLCKKIEERKMWGTSRMQELSKQMRQIELTPEEARFKVMVRAWDGGTVCCPNKLAKLKAEEQQEIKRAVEAGEINLESKRSPRPWILESHCLRKRCSSWIGYSNLSRSIRMTNRTS